MIQVTVINRTNGRISSAAARRIAAAAAAKLPGRSPSGQGRPKRIAVVFVTAQESRRLKRRFLRQDRAANVLAFRYDGEGEVLLTPALIRAEARRAGVPYRHRLGALLVHGLLHLHGYHHERSRREAASFERRERELLDALGLAPPSRRAYNYKRT